MVVSCLWRQIVLVLLIIITVHKLLLLDFGFWDHVTGYAGIQSLLHQQTAGSREYMKPKHGDYVNFMNTRSTFDAITRQWGTYVGPPSGSYGTIN